MYDWIGTSLTTTDPLRWRNAVVPRQHPFHRRRPEYDLLMGRVPSRQKTGQSTRCQCMVDADCGDARHCDGLDYHTWAAGANRNTNPAVLAPEFAECPICHPR